MPKDKDYDVFISYRRDKGVYIARTLHQALKQLGLHVFFDMEELTDGKFNDNLYDAIERSKNVIFLMTEGSLTRCANEGDWVRNELEHAMEFGKNLVPAVPSGTEIAFPEDLPEKLRPMKMLEVSELNLEKLFNESVTKIARRLKGVVLADEKAKKEAEETFLSQARRFKGNDGKIDSEELEILHETAKELGISKAKQLILIEKVESEYSSQTTLSGPEIQPTVPTTVVPRFDVFISYRREGGAADARLMYDRLTKEGYTVSLDMDTLKNGNFNEELLRRVAECRNFIILLNPGCFDRTLNGCRREDDWMRLELATALYNKKNIVTVMLPGFEYPAKLPPDIDAVRFKNGPKYDLYYLDSFYAKLQKDFLQTDFSNSNDGAAAAEKEVVSVDTKEVAYDASLDEIFGDDAGYWRIEANSAYHSISRVLPYGDLAKLDEAWKEAEDNLKGGDHSVASRKYMEVIELCRKIKPCSIPFATRLVGDGIDTHGMNWFADALARAQEDDMNYQYGVGMLYADGIGVAKNPSAAFRWFERAARGGKGHIQAITAVGAAYATGDGVEVDYKKARDYLTKAEEKGDARAMERIGYLYENGLGFKKKSVPIAISKYEKAAELGNSAAMVALGRILENGIGVAEDLAKAAAWYRSAVANDSAVAQRKLAEFLFLGKGGEKDWKEALRLARLASNQGDADAVAMLGRAYENGWGVEANGEKAEELYRKAMEKGSALGKSYLANLEADAQYRNGLKHMEGNGTVQDFALAKAWFEKAAAQGNVESMEQLGFLYERGLGCDVDTLKAKEWYEKAAEKGNAAAKVGLGKLYFQGYDGIAQDRNQALGCFKEAASTWRMVSAESRWKVIYLFFYLGRIYTEGLGVDKNVMMGWRAFLTGANNGNLSCVLALASSYEKGDFTGKSQEDSKRWYDVCAKAEKNVGYADDMAMQAIGTIYLHGKGVKKDLAKARAWFGKAAALGNVSCLTKLARAYKDGDGVPKNIGKAIELYTVAANRGFSDAQSGLSRMFYAGEGVEQDMEKALAWGLKAAGNGSAEGMETLYRMYRDGAGVEKDEAKALEWLKQSVSLGDASATAALGDHYEHGDLGLEVDMAKAVSLYRQAAEGDDTRGMLCLGLCSKEGKGVPQDDSEALAWMVKAAEKKDDDLHYDEKALEILADWFYGSNFKRQVKYFVDLDPDNSRRALWHLYRGYENENVLGKNSKRSWECLETSARLGYKYAQNTLGRMYYQGLDVKRDPKMAFEWTMRAVQNGNPDGMETLFRMYRDGDGVVRNEKEALRWLELAAYDPEETGCESSELGECYENGLLGLTPDAKKAFDLYCEASQKAKCPGKYNRGRCLLFGIGTPADVKSAVEWLTEAAENEDADDHKYDLLAMKLLVDLYTEGKAVKKDDAKAQLWQSRLDELKKKRTTEIPGFVAPF